MEQGNITHEYHNLSENINDGATFQQELTYLNTIGKRFVAATNRFQVHRALIKTLQELYSFSACCILLRGDTYELFIIPRYPLNATFLETMIQRIASAASAINFPAITAEQLAQTAYFDAPDELATKRPQEEIEAEEVRASLNIPLIVENRIIGLLSLFDEREGTFDTNRLQITTMIADYAAVALDNVRLRERENALWRETELERGRLQLILSSMAEGLLITDARGAITSLNTSAEHLLAQSLPAVNTGVPLHLLAASSNVPWLTQFVGIIQQSLTGQTITNQEITIEDDRERVPLTLSVSAAPLLDINTSGKLHPVGVVAVLNDITSSKQVERLKDDFVSVVSHELRTPLTAIKGYTQHLTRRLERRIDKVNQGRATATEATQEPAETYDLHSLAIIQSQTTHLERLVNDLIDHSQVHNGLLDLHYSTFDFITLLREAVRTAQASTEQHTIALEVHTRETMIKADHVRVRQVIGNILDNAVKYSPHGGQIVVTVELKNTMYYISVQDQGIGISTVQAEHIFERFYQLHNSTNQNYAGIGLGLYVTKAIIDSHGGSIWLTSEQERGSTFHFTLPQAPEANGQAKKMQAPDED